METIGQFDQRYLFFEIFVLECHLLQQRDKGIFILYLSTIWLAFLVEQGYGSTIDIRIIIICLIHGEAKHQVQEY